MRISLISALLMSATATWAEPPHVAVDIAPLHSLVARIMEGVGAPDLIVAPGASPHHYALRPSEANALAEADLVFWMGPDLTPWMEDTIDTLAGGARQIAMLEEAHSTLLSPREGIGFELEGDHDDHEDHADHDDHEEHDKHDDHDDHAAQDDHAEHEEHDAHHHHGDVDPHAWLSLRNAESWLTLIAGELSDLDPENGDIYRANMASGVAELASLSDKIRQEVAPVREVPFLVFHDAYQYFEKEFGIQAAGAVSLSDASAPGPARVAALRDLIHEQGIACVLTEPQFDPKLARAILPDGHKTGVLDLIGAGLEPGPDLYTQMMRSLAAGFASCAP